MMNIRLVAKEQSLTQTLDLQKKGIIPISPEKYAARRKEIVNHFFYLDYAPSASDLFGLYAPRGVSFANANKKSGRRYAGYHVFSFADTYNKFRNYFDILNDDGMGERVKNEKKLLFKLEKTLSDGKGNEIDVLNAADSIILARLGLVNGKPVIKYEIDNEENAIIVQINPDKQICVPFFTKNDLYVFENNVWTPSTDPDFFTKKDPSTDTLTLYFSRANANWGGLFALNCDIFSTYGISDRGVGVGLRLSYPLKVLAEETDANAPALNSVALAEKLQRLQEDASILPAATLKLIRNLNDALQ